MKTVERGAYQSDGGCRLGERGFDLRELIPQHTTRWGRFSIVLGRVLYTVVKIEQKIEGFCVKGSTQNRHS